MVPAFGPAFAVTSGLSPAAAGAVVSTMTWFVIPAVPLSAWLAQRLGRADVAMHASFALSAVALALLALSGPSVTLFALIGLCFAPPGGLIMTLPGEVLRPECRALGMGIFLTVYYAGIGILPALAGHARDVTGNAATPFWFAVALVLAAAVTLLLFRRLQARTVQVRDTLR
jgi:MFS family permease